MRVFILTLGIISSVSALSNSSETSSNFLLRTDDYEEKSPFYSDFFADITKEHPMFRYSKLKTFVFKWKDLKTMCAVEDTALIYLGYVQTVQSLNNYNRSNLTQENRLIGGKHVWIDLRQQFTPEHEIRLEFKFLQVILPPAAGVICVAEDAKVESHPKPTHRGRGTREWKVYPKNETGTIDTSASQSYYINSTNGKSSSLLEMEELGKYLIISEAADTIYLNETAHFVCKALSYVENLTFWVEFANGTKIELTKGVPLQYEIKIESPRYSRFSRWNLNINLTTETVAVGCQLPYYDHPTLYTAAIRRFSPKYLKEPKIDREKYVERQLFVCGETHKQLICSAEGEPQPTYTWLKDDMDIKQFPKLNLRAMIAHEGEGILEFPAIKKSHEGRYTCQATNRIEVDELVFYVFVQEGPIKHHEGISTLLKIFCIILVLVICGLGLVYKKYRAKKRIRQENDQELQNGISFMRLLL